MQPSGESNLTWQSTIQPRDLWQGINTCLLGQPKSIFGNNQNKHRSSSQQPTGGGSRTWGHCVTHQVDYRDMKGRGCTTPLNRWLDWPRRRLAVGGYYVEVECLSEDPARVWNRKIPLVVEPREKCSNNIVHTSTRA